MTKFEELKAKQIKTVEELIVALSKYPTTTKLEGLAGDLGGYDVCSQPHVSIETVDENTILFGHIEYEAYEAYSKKEITREQYEELIPN